MAAKEKKLKNLTDESHSVEREDETKEEDSSNTPKEKKGNLLFSKGQIISAMGRWKDPLTVLLSDEKSYTLEEANILLKKFFERKVK